MKMFRKVAKNIFYFGWIPVLMLGLVALLGAGITGEFTQVNSVNGYQVNGSAGSSGQALCSNGTYYANPCSMSGGTITGVTANAPLNGGGSSGSVSVGMSTSGVSAGSYTSPNITVDTYGRVIAASNPTFTGTSGYQVLPSGLILEWGISASFDTGPQSQTLPHQFPTACLFASASDNTASSARRIWAANCASTTAITLQNDGLGEGNWFAIGY